MEAQNKAYILGNTLWYLVLNRNDTMNFLGSSCFGRMTLVENIEIV